jgi:hypothetical protein
MLASENMHKNGEQDRESQHGPEVPMNPGDAPPLLGAHSVGGMPPWPPGTAARTSARPSWLWAGRLWADRVFGWDLDEQRGATAGGTADLERAAERLDAVAEPD